MSGLVAPTAVAVSVQISELQPVGHHAVGKEVLCHRIEPDLGSAVDDGVGFIRPAEVGGIGDAVRGPRRDIITRQAAIVGNVGQFDGDAIQGVLGLLGGRGIRLGQSIAVHDLLQPEGSAQHQYPEYDHDHDELDQGKTLSGLEGMS